MAPLTARAAHLEVGEGYWLRLDPVHLDVGMHGLFLRAGLQLDAEEIDQIHAIAATVLSPAGLRVHKGSDHALYVHCERAPELRTTPLDQVAGRQPMRFMPAGDDASTWTRLLNEIQMALHEHPLNLSRQARGVLPVNSLWPWGGGHLSQPVRQLQAIWGQAPLVRQMAAALEVPGNVPPSHLSQCLFATGHRGLVILEADPDIPASKLLQDWEDAWFKPLMHALRLGRLASSELIVLGASPVSSRLTPARAWRFWA